MVQDHPLSSLGGKGCQFREQGVDGSRLLIELNIMKNELGGIEHRTQSLGVESGVAGVDDGLLGAKIAQHQTTARPIVLDVKSNVVGSKRRDLVLLGKKKPIVANTGFGA